MEGQVKHICAVCTKEFTTEEEYLSHVCEKTGFAPTDPLHLINSTTPEFADIQKASLNRGSEEQSQTQEENK